MSNILFVTSSSRGNASYSNQIANRVIEEIRQSDPAARLVVRDLAQNPLPHIDSDFISATRGPNGAQTDRQRVQVAQSDALVDELFAADTIVIAAAMINFSVPSNLKAWIDHVARPGRTYKYSEKGPEGLVTGKRVIVVSASGGVYSAGAAAGFDSQIPWLKNVLGFLGMTNVEVIHVEGTAFGPEAAEKAVQSAVVRARDVASALQAA